MWEFLSSADEGYAGRSLRRFMERLKAPDNTGQGEVRLEGVAGAGSVEDRDVAYVEIQTDTVFLHPHQDIQPDQY
jgi:hypothetical protein